MLEQIINQLAQKIAQKRGFRTPYQLVIKPELPLDAKNKERIVIIQAGNPPIVYLSRLYVEASLNKGSKIKLPSLRDTLERILEKIPVMQHTLAITPLSDAIALKTEVRNWVKIKFDDTGVVLRDEFFEIDYQVTIKDIVTNTSITRQGKDINEVIKQAKYQLSRLVLEDEELREYRSKIQAIEDAKKKPIPPNEISIGLEGDKVNTNIEY